MNETGRALVEELHRRTAETLLAAPAATAARAGIHYTQLPPAKPGEPLFQEWNTYRREVGRLLNDGQGGRYVLIKSDAVIGIYDAWDAAREAGLKRYLLEPFLVHPIRAEEPHVRVRGLNLPCPS
jgi:hypothetical protein